MTEWVNKNGLRRYSASISEPRTGSLLTGWSTTDPGDRSLESLVDLVAYTTASIELADLLESARYEADHDRVGGDEFVVVLRGNDVAGATEIARSLRNGQQYPITIDDTDVDVRISIGVGMVDPPVDPAELARRADAALYQAKAAGRNTVRTYRREDIPAEVGALNR